MPSPAPAPTSDEPDFDAIAAAQKRARRKVWLIVFGSFGLLFALFAYAFIADEEPPDTSDLRVVFNHPPEDQNAYALLTKLVATLPPAPDDNTPEERHLARIFSPDPKDQVAWNHDVVAAVLRRYPPDLADQVRIALAAPESEGPEPKSYADTVPEVRGFRHLTATLTQQASLAWHTGDHNTATDLNLLVLHLGRRLSQSQGSLITVLTSVVIQLAALDSIRLHADSGTITPDTLRRYLAEIGHHEIQAGDYHTAFKLEYSVFGNEMPKITGSDIATLASMRPSVFTKGLSLPGLLQPNQTLRWHAEAMRTCIAATTDIAAEASAPILDDHWNSVPWPRRAQNLTGRIILNIVTPSVSALVSSYHRARANLRLTQIYVALRLYQLEHNGTLPVDLAELVPAYLPAIPLDPFGGQPLRYDRDLTTIWSIDKDHLNITNADGDFPTRNMPAHRLLFARPPVDLPAFVDPLTQPDAESGVSENP